MIWKRLRNLWKLSEYRVNENSHVDSQTLLLKDISSSKRKLATIIQEEEPIDIFNERESS